jgi:membrane protease YdiL (CAAX protease family)
MRRFRDLLLRHQLTSFFLLTYLFTWTLLIPMMITRDEETWGVLGLLGLFGPAVVNIFISRQLSDRKSTGRRKKFWITFVLTWIVCTVVFTLNASMNSTVAPVAVAVFSIISFLPAWVFASGFAKTNSVSHSLASLVNPKGHWKYYTLALLLIPIIRLISIPISETLGLPNLAEPEPPDGTGALSSFILITFFWGFFFAGGLNEEVGWSGFALPRLQKLYSPFVASIVLWFFWMLWHIPMSFAGWWNPDPADIIRALIGGFFARILLTWIYNQTYGGILAVMILHVSANVAFSVLPHNMVAMVMEAALVVYLIYRFRMLENTVGKRVTKT